jgi:hypothetical protein
MCSNKHSIVTDSMLQLTTSEHSTICTAINSGIYSTYRLLDLLELLLVGSHGDEVVGALDPDGRRLRLHGLPRLRRRPALCNPLQRDGSETGLAPTDTQTTTRPCPTLVVVSTLVFVLSVSQASGLQIRLRPRRLRNENERETKKNMETSEQNRLLVNASLSTRLLKRRTSMSHRIGKKRTK